MVWQFVRQLVYTIFITNNYNSFHLWWKENLVKHQIVWKYYDQDCCKNLLKNINQTFRVVHYLTWKLELVSDILGMIVSYQNKLAWVLFCSINCGKKWLSEKKKLLTEFTKCHQKFRRTCPHHLLKSNIK